MTIKEIIDGLKFTVDMFLFDPGTGEIYKDPRNDMDKTTIDACEGAIELLEQTMWIPVSERLPNFNDIVLASADSDYDELRVIITVYRGEEFWFNGKIKAWMPLPAPYKEKGGISNAM